jgi:hypothetical protein
LGSDPGIAEDSGLAAGAVTVIASEAKQSSVGERLDCFVAKAPRNDDSGVQTAG